MGLNDITVGEALTMYAEENTMLVLNDGAVKGLEKITEKGLEVWTFRN